MVSPTSHVLPELYPPEASETAVTNDAPPKTPSTSPTLGVLPVLYPAESSGTGVTGNAAPEAPLTVRESLLPEFLEPQPYHSYPEYAPSKYWGAIPREHPELRPYLAHEPSTNEEGLLPEYPKPQPHPRNAHSTLGEANNAPPEAPSTDGEAPLPEFLEPQEYHSYPEYAPSKYWEAIPREHLELRPYLAHASSTEEEALLPEHLKPQPYPKCASATTGEASNAPPEACSTHREAIMPEDLDRQPDPEHVASSSNLYLLNTPTSTINKAGEEQPAPEPFVKRGAPSRLHLVGEKTVLRCPVACGRIFRDDTAEGARNKLISHTSYFYNQVKIHERDGVPIIDSMMRHAEAHLEQLKWASEYISYL
ncbi:uncharacterized protein LAJ45_01101 [Morchella importuna]|uniref:uncharacterized protein n=1 Tax=Morchella importuna TaxID=1174673 RepID=UPI001E8D05A2|nr:uncharacterized protein LAJ45_01101 [Morchella importuna]KAH8154573.1 hypothetical protein LAJ45_01101 [Morchella importuna]